MNQPEILTPKSNLVPMGSQRPGERENQPPGVGDVSTTCQSAPCEHPVACEHPAPLPEPATWQQAMKRAVRSGSELRRLLGLPQIDDVAGETDFPTFVTRELLSRIRYGDESDPILRQVLPVADEDRDVDGFDSDPVGDLGAIAAPGLLHKYHGRALMVSTGSCGVHCRYCFRREFPYSESGAQSDRYEQAVEYLREQPEIDEVLLSGGDPLTLVDETLFTLISRIESVDHAERLRIHSRMPIVVPQRVTAEFVERLSQSRLSIWFVIHVNHPNEWDDSVGESVARLVDAGIPCLNQAVLLCGVNDDVATLERLCRTLVNNRVQPYYLHQLDRVRGAAHFEVPVQKGLQLIQQLRERLPGYAVPSFVHEQPGEPSKTLLA